MEEYTRSKNIILADIGNYEKCLKHLTIFRVQSSECAKFAGDTGGMQAVAKLVKNVLAYRRTGKRNHDVDSVFLLGIRCLNQLAFYNQNSKCLAEQEVISVLCEALLYAEEIESELLPLLLNAVH